MKRLISALLAIFTVAALVCVPVVATEPAETFWVDQVPANHTLQGSGTVADPYLITSAIDLAYLAKAICQDTDLTVDPNAWNNLQFSGKYFLQTADIDLSAHTWIPIGGVKVNRIAANGTSGTPAANFVGNYDGNYHSITGMKVTDNSFKYNLYNGTLGTTTNAVGTVQLGSGAGLFGRFGNNNTNNLQTLSNLAVTGTINLSVAVSRVGGIVGYLNTPFMFENLYSNVTINTTTADTAIYVGGIFGQNDKSAFTENGLINCVAEGDINATTSASTVDFIVGGLFGKWVGAANKVLTNCYYTGDITINQTAAYTTTSKTFFVGGLFGQLGDAVNKLNNVNMFGTTTVNYTGNGENSSKYAIGDVAGYWKVSGGFEGANNSYVKTTATGVGSWNAGDYKTAAVDSFEKLDAAGTVPFATTNKLLVAPDSVVLRFAQERVKGDAMDVRFLGTGVVGASGFKVTAKLGDVTGTPNVDIPVEVFDTIDADGKTGITAQDLGGKAGDKILGLVITGVPTTGTVTFVITPYVGTTEGATMTIVYTDGVYTSCTIAD